MEPWYREASYRNLTIRREEGSLTGYEVPLSQPNFFNWLSGLVPEEEAQRILDQVSQRHRQVAVIKSMWVEHECRGQGVGNDMLEEFLSSSSATAFFLEADTYETNKFNLVKWYEGYGFKVIAKSGGNPVMMMEVEE